MIALTPPPLDRNERTPDFTLKDADGTPYTRDQLKGENGLLVAFICNHCPYVQAILPSLQALREPLLALNIPMVAIMPNDIERYPQDAPIHMKELGLPFAYLYDESQEVARAFGAVCTPDFFGYNKDLALRYRGRLDAKKGTLDDVSAKTQKETITHTELYCAMRDIASEGECTRPSMPSIGCSIKWREDIIS